MRKIDINFDLIKLMDELDQRMKFINDNWHGGTYAKDNQLRLSINIVHKLLRLLVQVDDEEAKETD